MKYIVYNTQTAHGVKVITDNLVKSLIKSGVEAFETNDLTMCDNEDVVIPYGVKECHEVVKRGYNRRFGLLVDAISLGYLNKIKFYLKTLHILQYDFFYSIYGFLRYSIMEKRVVKSYDNLMLVSPIDIDYLKRNVKGASCNYHCIPNGAFFLEQELDKKTRDNDNVLKIGVLSSWVTKQTFQESNWFFERYFKKYAKNHNDVEIIVAGRGERINNLQGKKNVKVLGEVSDLSYFFDSIDVFLSLSPKGCGILNRVLDAITYRVPVAGIEASFTGFPMSESAFAKFCDYSSFCNCINKLKDKEYREKIEENAYRYARTNNNWDINYERLADIIKSKS